MFRNRCYAAVHLLLEDKQQVFPMSDFIQMFADRYNDLIDEHTIRTMKHAIEVIKKTNPFIRYKILSLIFYLFFHIQVYHVNNIKCVKVTKMMDFLVHIIDSIGEGTVQINDIYHSLKLSIKSCFPFGQFAKH